MNRFVHDCIELYLHDTPPRHGELFRFNSWDKVTARYQSNQSFQRVDKMLRNGYKNKDWQKTRSKFTKGSSHSHMLGRIEDVRNHEFQTVMVTPEVVSLAWQAEAENLAAVGSAIYVAVTRAKQCLIVPVSILY